MCSSWFSVFSSRSPAQDSTASGHMRSLYDQIVLFGDSITEFSEAQNPLPPAIDDEKSLAAQTFSFAFAPALRSAYIRRLEVANRGFSGYNTDQALQILHRIIPSPQFTRIRLMFIFFGANDSCFPMEQNNQCVPLPRFKDNLRKIVHDTRLQAHSPKIVLINPPPIDETRQMMMDARNGYPRRRTAENTKLYADAVKEVGKDLGLPVVDLWAAFAAVAGWQPGQELPGLENGPVSDDFNDLLSDGLHFTGAGYQILHREIVSTIRQSAPELLPENLPMVMPEWKAVTPDMKF